MSALDDAYRAAARELRDIGFGFNPDSIDETERTSAMQVATLGVNAFLAHLADNPPEEMVEAARSIEGWEQGPRRTADSLSTALRSIVGVKTDA